MSHRRDFLKQSASLVMGGLAFSYSDQLFAKPMHSVGIQLYTLMSVIDKDVEGTLKQVVALGYKDLESAFSMKGGFYGMSAKEFAALAKKLGLFWRSHHVMGAPLKPNPNFDVTKLPKFDTLKNDTQKIVDSVAEGGISYLVCANIPIDTGDEVKEAVDILSKAGEAAKKAGLTFVYHNHDKEFAQVDGKRPYDVFLSQISPDLMKMELDLAWVTKAGVDPVELFKKYPGRFPLWHVKDFDKEFKTLLPVGQGVVDFKKIFAAAQTAGMKYFFVEHDMAPQPFESIKASMDNLKKVLA
ncbi:sugar phosphate isomerase/epimerase [Xanthocytophaga agilis]|uniref:Sugar phosphate isomerase/epimerase n=1 Tax=Xanthocytophaga agilis TaxID=3048010 RepID=A0AAE3UHZ4_9BACT|nr:sugar phosphate isomerase/epimerase [Xanthocytophaga agilis]MDJ1504826.1 sugar phosphate isomerase/epimerase [Xanthocytophaga agilis]